MQSSLFLSIRCARHGRLHSHQRSIFTAADFFSSEALEAASNDLSFPIVVSEDGTHALRKRRDGNKPLPLPPHMDPVRRAQRNRWKDVKKRPVEEAELTELQKKLRANVYARALATPVRQCRLTSARLPSFFLLPLAATPIPQPEEQARDESLPQIPKSQSKPTSNPHALLPVELFAEANEELRDQMPAIKRRNYVVLHQSKLEHVSAKKNGAMQLIDQDTKKHLVKMMGKAKLEWRSDMCDFVRDLLQQVVVTELRAVIQNRSGMDVDQGTNRESAVDECIVACPSGVAGLHEVRGAACVLYLWPIKSAARTDIEQQLEGQDEVVESATKVITTLTRNYHGPIHVPGSANGSAMVPRLNPTIQKAPFDFPSVEYRDGRIPVYGLAELLSEEEMRKAVKGTEFENEKCLVVTQSARSLRLQSSLLKLQTYLAEP